MKNKYSTAFILLATVLCLTACTCGKGADITETRSPEFIDLQEIIPSVHLDIKYFTADNFVGTRIDGYGAPKCLLTKKAALALNAVQMGLAKSNLALKIFDCYRPQRAVNHFIRWAKDLADQKTKSDYYPSVDKKDLFKLGYLAEKSSHSRGSTVDLTVIDLTTKRELNMGTRFDFFDPLSNTDNPLISKTQRNNRVILKSVMERHGFTNLKTEWWHFTLNNETFPDSYFDFVIK